MKKQIIALALGTLLTFGMTVASFAQSGDGSIGGGVSAASEASAWSQTYQGGGDSGSMGGIGR